MIPEWMRLVALGSGLVGIVLWVVILVKLPGLRLHTVSPIAWLVNVSAFQSYRIFVYERVNFLNLTPIDLNLWSLVIQLHAIWMIVGIAALVLWYYRDISLTLRLLGWQEK